MWIKNYPAPRPDPWHRGYPPPEPIWHFFKTDADKGIVTTVCGLKLAIFLLSKSDIRDTLAKKTKANVCKKCKRELRDN